MRVRIFTYCLFFILGGTSLTVKGSAMADSIGRRMVNGKVVVLHKVESKQTVYAIAKIYNVSQDAIYGANPTAKIALKVGQIIKVPTEIDADGNSTVINSSGQKTHKVAKKETLYSISKMYAVGVEEIKRWNGLSSSELSLGQTLLVSGNGIMESTPKKEEIIVVSSASLEDEKEVPVKEEPAPKKETPAPKKEEIIVVSAASLEDEKVEPKKEEVIVAKKVVQKTDPVKETKVQEPVVKVETKKFPPGTKTHTVAKQETMYGISKKYGVSVDDLKKWNEMSSSGLSEGQVLAVSGEPSKKTEPVVAKKTTKTNTPKTNSNPAARTSKPAANPESRFSGDASFTSTNGGEERFHSVSKGEGLYSISKKYGVSIDNLKKWNGLPSSSITEGQILLVTRPSSNYSSAMDDLFAVNVEESGGTATKRSGGTNSNGSSKDSGPEVYSKSTDPFYRNNPNRTTSSTNNTNTNSYSGNGGSRSLNEHRNMTNTDHSEKNEVAQALNTSNNKLEKHEEKRQAYVSAGDGTTQPGPKKDMDHWQVPSNVKTWEDSVKFGIRGIKLNVGQYGKIVESGVCELIEDNHWDSKYNCLHHDAAIGTIIQVRNPENDIKVFVRVVGRLIEDSKHPHRIIKISHHAVERLAPARARFAIEISYVNMVKPAGGDTSNK